MKRKEFNETLKNYADYVNKTDYNVAPTKTIHSGCAGNLFEMEVKKAFNNIRGRVVSKGKVDTKKRIDGRIHTFEIKTGCGELAQLDRNGNIIKSCFDNDFIIYCPKVETVNDNGVITVDFSTTYVFTNDNFKLAVDRASMLRYKTTSSQKNLPTSMRYYDRLTLQSFSNSKKKTALWFESLETYGTPFTEFCQDNNLI